MCVSGLNQACGFYLSLVTACCLTSSRRGASWSVSTIFWNRSSRGIRFFGCKHSYLTQILLWSKFYLILEVGAGPHLDVHHVGLVEVGEETFEFEVVWEIEGLSISRSKVFWKLLHIYQQKRKIFISKKEKTFISMTFVAMELGHHISQRVLHQLSVTPGKRNNIVVEKQTVIWDMDAVVIIIITVLPDWVWSPFSGQFHLLQPRTRSRLYVQPTKKGSCWDFIPRENYWLY